MEKCRVLLFFGLLAAAACELAKADVQCEDYDQKIQDSLFTPLEKLIVSKNASYYNIVPFSTGSFFGLSLTTSDGTIGNLSNIGLHHQSDSTRAASQMCVDTSPATVVKTLTATFTLNKLQAVFNKLTVNLPILPAVGNSKTTIEYQDEGIFVNVTIARQTADKTCTVALNSLGLLGLGDAGVEFDSGAINTIYAFIFNKGWDMIKSILESADLVDTANETLTEFGNKIISSQAETLCSMFDLL